jgi:hypothetical protein
MEMTMHMEASGRRAIFHSPVVALLILLVVAATAIVFLITPGFDAIDWVLLAAFALIVVVAFLRTYVQIAMSLSDLVLYARDHARKTQRTARRAGREDEPIDKIPEEPETSGAREAPPHREPEDHE